MNEKLFQLVYREHTAHIYTKAFLLDSSALHAKPYFGNISKVAKIWLNPRICIMFLGSHIAIHRNEAS